MRFRDMPKLPLVLLALMLVIGIALYPQLPARIPMHWGPSGQIDGWGGKSPLTVFFAPLMLGITYLVLWFAPLLDPQRGNLLRSKRVYGIAVELLGMMMTVVFFGQLWASWDHAVPMSRIVMAATGLMFIVLGNYMGRVKRNWTMGVRYSWTLSDDVVWAKTNRLGGWLFMGAGVLAVLGAFAPPLVGLALILVPSLVILPVTYVYSMRLYRERHPDELVPPTPVMPAEEAAAAAAEGAERPRIVEADPHAKRIDTTCPHCGAENAPGNERCIRCGEPLS